MEQLLTKLKTIEPNKNFKERSRALILSSPQDHLRPNFWHSLAANYRLSLGAAGIILALSALTFFTNSLNQPALASLDQNSLKNEMESLDLQIKLSQAEYYADSAAKIEIALKETSGELPPPIDAEIDQLIEKLAI